MSECYVCVISGFGDLHKHLTTCGKITVNLESKVVDSNGNCVPYNQAGELWVRGYCTFLYYKDEPELTESVKTAEGWLKTGYVNITHVLEILYHIALRLIS